RDHFQVRQRLKIEERLIAAPAQRPLRSGIVSEAILARIIDVDPLEIVEVDRVRGCGPDAAEEIRVSDLEPETAPTARGMSRHKPSPRLADGAEGLFNVRDQFIRQRSAAGTIVR